MKYSNDSVCLGRIILYAYVCPNSIILIHCLKIHVHFILPVSIFKSIWRNILIDYFFFVYSQWLEVLSFTGPTFTIHFIHGYPTPPNPWCRTLTPAGCLRRSGHPSRWLTLAATRPSQSIRPPRPLWRRLWCPFRQRRRRTSPRRTVTTTTATTTAASPVRVRPTQTSAPAEASSQAAASAPTITTITTTTTIITAARAPIITPAQTITTSPLGCPPWAPQTHTPLVNTRTTKITRTTKARRQRRSSWSHLEPRRGSRSWDPTALMDTTTPPPIPLTPSPHTQRTCPAITTAAALWDTTHRVYSRRHRHQHLCPVDLEPKQGQAQVGQTFFSIKFNFHRHY